MQAYYALIMAGGGGTRLWPLSRQETPKQLLPLIEAQSMFRVSVERLAPLFPPERIYVVTGARYVDALRADAPAVPAENFIVEPYGKESGPAAAIGVAVIARRDPKATIAILTADHHIADKARFRDALAAAYSVAQSGQIVTLGITPNHPAIAFGYIERGAPLPSANGFAVYQAARFLEKPTAERAAAFILSGHYSWNSGMFIWRAETALREFETQQPDLHRSLMAWIPTIDTPHMEETLAEIWETVRKISLDYAVMEKAASIAVIPIDIGWSDVGSWDAVMDALPPDENGNRFQSHSPVPIAIDTRQTFIHSDKLVVTIGVDDLIVIQTEDALLICKKDRAQEVKQVVTALRDNHLSQYL